MRLFVVTLEAVYDHGCLGVFTNLEAAKTYCRNQWAQSDGHHKWWKDT